MPQRTSKYKLEFTLKQHAPIIHFQAEQKGATLRATELKPKLDRFLIEKFKKEGVDYKPFLIVGQDGALDYKVRVEPNFDSVDNSADLRSSLYFAGRKPNYLTEEETKEFENNRKKFKSQSKKFKIYMTVFNGKLKIAIEEWFSSFIFQTNFGTRQSKGFGSFVVLDDELKELPKNLYKFTASSQKDAFDKINYFYKMLRSGINEYKKDNNDEQVSIFYGKSLLWLYAKEKKWMWDKKAIKKYFFNDKRKQEMSDHEYPNIMCYTSKGYLVRDLLGLSVEQSWFSYRATVLKADENRKITRFKSPITFKPIQTKDGYDVYYWANDIPKEFLKSTFQIYLSDDKKNIKKLSPPDNFSIDKFLEFIFDFKEKKTLSQHIDEKYYVDPPNTLNINNYYNPTSIYTKLTEVFDSIERIPNAKN